MRSLISFVLLGAALVACSPDSSETAATTASNVEEGSSTQLVPFVTREDALAQAALFGRRHPGWKTTNIDRLTGAIAYSSRSVAEAAGEHTDAELLTAARAWLLADADIHGISASDLREVQTDYRGDADGFGAYVIEHRIVGFWAPVARPGYERFPELNGRFEIQVFMGRDGEPSAVRMGLGGGVAQDSRHLPKHLALTIGTAPKLPESDPRALANVIGRPLKKYRAAEHDLVPVGDVERSDVTSLVPTVHIEKEDGGVRLTMAYRVKVTKGGADFDFVVDGATGAMIDDNAFCFSGPSEAAWCAYQAAFERDPFPSVGSIALASFDDGSGGWLPGDPGLAEPGPETR